MKILNYCRETDTSGKKGLKKWFKLAEEHIEYKYIKYRKFKEYSEGELIKLEDYDNITTMIVDDILELIDENQETAIGIEGYSFSSSAGDIIDLVTFSTLLRKKLFKRVSKDITVLSPSTLKLETCKLSYEPIVKKIGGKNPRTEYIYKNDWGIPGGRFKKPQMLKSIIDNKKMNDRWANHCRLVEEDLKSIKTIPKPYEDCNDAYLLFKVIEDMKSKINK